jgi:hypothetical protein
MIPSSKYSNLENALDSFWTTAQKNCNTFAASETPLKYSNYQQYSPSNSTIINTPIKGVDPHSAILTCMINTYFHIYIHHYCKFGYDINSTRLIYIYIYIYIDQVVRTRAIHPRSWASDRSLEVGSTTCSLFIMFIAHVYSCMRHVDVRLSGNGDIVRPRGNSCERK